MKLSSFVAVSALVFSGFAIAAPALNELPLLSARQLPPKCDDKGVKCAAYCKKAGLKSVCSPVRGCVYDVMIESRDSFRVIVLGDTG
ncbi:hypothetical protein FQN57_004211 [Myotisia sp. PD_48]|nr:hypothetical protein FQN57_004211 [Myotisia sp. PD_48]